jgi:two-component system, cell cycle response regulator
MYRSQATEPARALPAFPLAPIDPPIDPLISQTIGIERRSRPGELRRVLVAESDRALRERLNEMLTGWGFDVVLAGDGTEAFNILTDERLPDLAILGRTLAAIGGVELCRRISGLASDRNPYLLVLGKRGSRSDVVHALESGADECLSAPIDERELKARLAVALRILKRRDELIAAREAFRDEATRDALTGAWTRRAILEILEAELIRATQRTHPAEQSTGILLLDLDHFKNVNDTHGHLAGDQVLAEAGARLSRQLRGYDAIGRYGGEEFMVVAPGCLEGELFELAERLREAIECEDFCGPQSAIRMTVSIGAAIVPPAEATATFSIASADAGLYMAKRAGRNRIAWCPSRPQSAEDRTARFTSLMIPACEIPASAPTAQEAVPHD